MLFKPCPDFLKLVNHSGAAVTMPQSMMLMAKRHYVVDAVIATAADRGDVMRLDITSTLGAYHAGLLPHKVEKLPINYPFFLGDHQACIR